MTRTNKPAAAAPVPAATAESKSSEPKPVTDEQLAEVAGGWGVYSYMGYGMMPGRRILFF